MPPVPKPRSRSGDRRGGNRALILAVALGVATAAGLAIASLVLRGGDEQAPIVGTGSTALVDGIPQNGTVLGDAAATVTLLQYEDLQCPYCKLYTDAAFPAIVDEYVRTGKVKVDFRGLEFLGDDSNKALRAVLAAAKQNKAWQLIELLYDHQGAENSGWVTDDLVSELAGSIAGLDVGEMQADAASTDTTAEIEALGDEARKREVGGTPWFFVAIGDAEPYPIQPQPRTDPAAFRPIFADALGE